MMEHFLPIAAAVGEGHIPQLNIAAMEGCVLLRRDSWGRSSSSRVSFTANCMLFMELMKAVALMSGVTIPSASIRHSVTWAGSSTPV